MAEPVPFQPPALLPFPGLPKMGTSVFTFSTLASRLMACIKLYRLPSMVTKHSASAALTVSFACIMPLSRIFQFLPYATSTVM